MHTRSLTALHTEFNQFKLMSTVTYIRPNIHIPMKDIDITSNLGEFISVLYSSMDVK